MKRHSSESNGRRLRATAAAFALGLLSLGLSYGLWAAPVSATGAASDAVNNNRPVPNPGGAAATFSTQGSVDLTGEYFQAQGTNGRSCATCHIPEEAWGINPGTLQRLFGETGSTHPVFNKLDANNPTRSPPSRPRSSYSPRTACSSAVASSAGAARPSPRGKRTARSYGSGT